MSAPAMSHSVWLRLASITVACLAAGVASQGLRTGIINPLRGSDGAVRFKLTFTATRGAPACGPARAVILINGLFQPTLYAAVNDTIQIDIENLLPPDMPQTASGVSLHFHGLYMWNEDAWADGTAYLTQCPVAIGTRWSYSFKADAPPGTYFWHDHSAVNRANGLQGALMLRLPDVDPPLPVPVSSDGEYVLFISDWYNTEANVMAMQLNRPFDTTKATDDTGTFQWVSNPDAMLINGKGNQADCDVSKVTPSKKTPYDPPVCNVTTFTIPPSGDVLGCSHAQFSVQPDKHYLFRVINAATAQHVTVCFEGHEGLVALVASDTMPMDFAVMDSGCFDIASGQRYDVNLTTSAPADLYWISVHTQYAAASPSGYAVLRYQGAATPGSLPRTATPQGTVEPWDADTQSLIVASDRILGFNDNYDDDRYWALFRHGGVYDSAALFYQTQPDKVVTFNMTQPLLGNGMLRWAINNVAMPSSPPCQPVMDMWMADPGWAARNAAPNSQADQAALSEALVQVSTWTTDTTGRDAIYTERTQPVAPVAGLHVIELEHKALVDLVINNLPGSANNGDYRNVTRASSVDHPMHLHGHKFWVLGSGQGIYNASKDYDTLNLFNPVVRDTAVLPAGGWLYLRFRADNPGMWPLHCHNMWHAYMGQQVVFAEAMDKLPARPKPGPPCPATCINNFAPFTRSWVGAHLRGGSLFQLPP